MNKKTPSPPTILRQITGAVVGGTIALVAYNVYDFGAPLVTGWLIPPGYEAELGHNTIADKDIDATDARHIQAQARRIAANTRTVPEYSTYTQPVRASSVASSSSFSSEAVDSIWEQEWTEQKITPTPTPTPTPIPTLPSSGLGVWLAMGIAGAVVGSRYRRVKQSKA